MSCLPILTVFAQSSIENTLRKDSDLTANLHATVPTAVAIH